VLVALARRNLLPEFDYLSTVSGGGYLGSFLTTYLNSDSPSDAAPALGLCKDQLPFRRSDGEAQALRHIRHFSKYLATGSVWERAKMTTAQLYGLLINVFGVAYLGAFAALVEFVLRSVGVDHVVSPMTWLALIGLAAASVMVPLILRWGGAWDGADKWLAIPAIALVVLIVWRLLGLLHGSYDFYAWGTTPLIVAAVVPLFAAGIVGFFGGLPVPVRFALSVLAAAAAPVFILLADLATYEWIERAPWPHALILLIVIVLATGFFFYLLNINITSPHRHYRKKLGEAYLIQPDANPPPDADPDLRLISDASRICSEFICQIIPEICCSNSDGHPENPFFSNFDNFPREIPISLAESLRPRISTSFRTARTMDFRLACLAPYRISSSGSKPK
jgi:hypothetical protein